MDTATFWWIVDAARGSDGDDAHAARLRDQLLALTPQEIAEFARRFRQLHESAVSQDLWAAGMLLNGGHGSDDRFEYFRNWLISRGRATFERALIEPDSLSDELVGDNSSAEFAMFGYAASDAYHAVTGEEYELEGLAPGPAAGNARDFTNAPEVLTRRLPRLWRKYGARKARFDEEVSRFTAALMAADGESVDVEGLGQVRIGDVLVHPKHGAGTVRKMTRSPPLIAVISFKDRDHSMVLSAAFLSRP